MTDSPTVDKIRETNKTRFRAANTRVMVLAEELISEEPRWNGGGHNVIHDQLRGYLAMLNSEVQTLRDIVG